LLPSAGFIRFGGEYDALLASAHMMYSEALYYLITEIAVIALAFGITVSGYRRLFDNMVKVRMAVVTALMFL
jgi:hypothetical protein